jgi:hypothetical protein
MLSTSEAAADYPGEMDEIRARLGPLRGALRTGRTSGRKKWKMGAEFWNFLGGRSFLATAVVRWRVRDDLEQETVYGGGLRVVR